jgi:hypothetical protein
MSTMNESEKELYQVVHAMTFADVRNELQLHSLPITGTRTSCTRLFKYKRQQLATESASKVNLPKRIITRQAAKAQAELATVQNLEGEGSLTQFAAQEALNIPSEQEASSNETLEAKVNGAKLSTEEIDQRVEQILDTRLAKHLAEWQEQFLQVLTETQIAANKVPCY